MIRVRSAPDGTGDLRVQGDPRGVNLIPFATIAGGWLGPLLMFWLYYSFACGWRVERHL